MEKKKVKGRKIGKRGRMEVEGMERRGEKKVSGGEITETVRWAERLKVRL